MWEAYGLKNEDFLWAGVAFRGGIAGQQQATCGAVSAAALALGLRHRRSLADKEKAEKARNAANEEAGELIRSFIHEFGAVNCFELIGVDFSDEEARKRARESGLFEQKCHKQIQFVIEKLYELDEKRGLPKNPGSP
jgi:C_GCAxxG_C_C family probable redox protein